MSVTTLLLLASSSPPRLLSKLLCNAITPCSSPCDSMAHGLRVWIGGVSTRLPRGGQHAVHSNTTVLPSTTSPPLLLGCRACAVLLRWPGAEIGMPLSTLSHRTPLPTTGLATRSTRCSGRIYPFASFTMVRMRARAPPQLVQQGARAMLWALFPQADEPVDPKGALEKQCHSSCKKQWAQYTACTERVAKKGEGDCQPWAFDYWHCVDHCVRDGGVGCVFPGAWWAPRRASPRPCTGGPQAVEAVEVNAMLLAQPPSPHRPLLAGTGMVALRRWQELRRYSRRTPA